MVNNNKSIYDLIKNYFLLNVPQKEGVVLCYDVMSGIHINIFYLPPPSLPSNLVTSVTCVHVSLREWPLFTGGGGVK